MSSYRMLLQLVLHQVAPVPAPSPDGLKLGVTLETGTIGLGHAAHDVIEIGKAAFTNDGTAVRDVLEGGLRPA